MSKNLPVVDNVCLLPAVIEEAWSTLVSTGSVESSLLRHEIASSWQRSLSHSLDPLSVTPPPLVTCSEVLEPHRMLVAVAKPHMHRLFEFLQGKDYIVMLLSVEGYILSLFGDKRMSNIAEALNVYPGTDNSEKFIGTTAPGISLMRGIAIQVYKQEHYSRWPQEWCCSSAPIFNNRRELLGAINVANTDIYKHPAEILNLVELAAEGIGAEYSYRYIQRDYQKLTSYFNTVADSTSDALMVFDQNDTIIHINKHAQQLLGGNAQRFVGQTAHRLIANYTSAKNGLNAGKQWAELRCTASARTITLDAQLKMLQADALEPLGILGILKKQQKPVETGEQIHYGFQDFIFSSESVARLIDDANHVADTDHTILILGESGTGKEVLAQALHRSSSRRDKPFVAINCAALPTELIQSELFGYEGGSFTGASKGGKAGKFELADGGTIFLDEIGDMPLEAQANLLRVLQEKKIVRIGGVRQKEVNVRIIAATNRELLRDVEAGRFRSDLFYRLCVINLHIPPLRERREDIWTLVAHFVDKISGGRLSFHEISFSKQARTAIQTYAWPGNVRELENATICFLAKMRDGIVTLNELPPQIFAKKGPAGEAVDELRVTERRTIEKALLECAGHISNAAKLLGTSRSTLYRKLKKYGL